MITFNQEYYRPFPKRKQQRQPNLTNVRKHTESKRTQSVHFCVCLCRLLSRSGKVFFQTTVEERATLLWKDAHFSTASSSSHRKCSFVSRHCSLVQVPVCRRQCAVCCAHCSIQLQLLLLLLLLFGSLNATTEGHLTDVLNFLAAPQHKQSSGHI